MEIEKLKYPIGKANLPEVITKKKMEEWISILERFPQELEFLTRDLSENQLDTPYRENGWTIRQVIHHCYDSHLNSYTRFKLALTEAEPKIKPYNEALWAELNDSKTGPIALSVDGLKALHARWVYFLNELSDNDFKKTFIHPATNTTYSLKKATGVYAWHSLHHFAHIKQLMIRKGWK